MDANQSAKLVKEALESACDTAASRRRIPSVKKTCHWWSENIATLRRTVTSKGRKWKRTRRSRRADAETLEILEQEYRVAKKELRKEVSRAKAAAWKELVEMVEADPWGLPYRVVLKRYT